MILSALFLSLLLALEAHAQSASSGVILYGTNAASISLSGFGTDFLPTGSEVLYTSYSTTTTQNVSAVQLATMSADANRSASASISSHTTSTSTSVLVLQGTVRASSTGARGRSTLNATASSTATSTTPVNTQPCNNYPEFCSRSYSNITMVAAHNSPFVNPNNAAANQEYGVLAQLNDGIRMLTGETHYNSTTETISYCHTSCDLLNAGTAQEYFTNVTSWVKAHPYDVVTLLLVNSDFIGVGNYTGPLEASGLSRYAYIPSQVPMNLSSWPTLGQMLLNQKRVVIFMDYNANQTKVPYILDEFSHMWETPFSPTNVSFPCTQQRPPGLDRQQAEQRMYLANHNLNTEITFAGTSILIPTVSLVNETNALNGTGSLGLAANNCIADWGRPPNFLLVDYFNDGSYPGSVFETAARQNNVTYNRACCGKSSTSAASHPSIVSPGLLSLASIWLVMFLLS